MPEPPRGRKQLEQDEKEIGKNIPDGMKGLDTEDVGDPAGAPTPERDE